jgi:hypothetical protein
VILAVAKKKLVFVSWRFIRENVRMIGEKIKNATRDPWRKQGKNLVDSGQKKC